MIRIAFYCRRSEKIEIEQPGAAEDAVQIAL